MNQSNQKVYKIYDKKNIVIYIGSKTNLFSKNLLKKVKKIIEKIS